MEELTADQMKLVDKYTKKRSKDLSFGPMFKEERTYFTLHKATLTVLETPKEILDILENTDEGYYCPDFHDKYVYAKNDKLKNKPIALIKVLSKALKNNPEKFTELKKKFDQRLGTSQKENIECSICITHNPYDIAGMSTGREWTSCMELDTGAFKDTPLKQVQYGGMCAYLIRTEDKNIKEPLARIAIKRFIGDKNGFIFKPETRIYGREDFAKSLEFLETVTNILETSNRQTSKFEGVYFRRDNGSYSDTYQDSIIADLDAIDWNNLSKKDITLISKNFSATKNIEKYADKLDLTAFVRHITLDIPRGAFGWTTEKIIKFIKKHEDKVDINKVLFDDALSFDANIFKAFSDKLKISKIDKNLDEISEADPEFIKKHLNEFDLTKILLKNENSSYAIAHLDAPLIANNIDWNYYSKNADPFKIDVVIYRKFKEYINWDEVSKHFCRMGFPEYVERSGINGWDVQDFLKEVLNFNIIAKYFDFRNKRNSNDYIKDFIKTFQGKIKAKDLLNNQTLTPSMKSFIRSTPLRINSLIIIIFVI